MTPTAVDPTSLRASRAKLLLIALVFAAPIIAAGLLTATGWQPSGKGNGLPVEPQRNLADEHAVVTLDDGQVWAWRDAQPHLTLVALVGPGCAEHCMDALTKMAAARITLNQNAERLRLLLVGPAPTQREVVARYWKLGSANNTVFAGFTPGGADEVSALLVESDGTLLSFYPVGFDASGLRKDLQKVIR